MDKFEDLKQNEDVGLSFKSHAQAFVTLDQRMEYISQLESKSKFHPGMIVYYLAAVQSLLSKYAMYISDEAKIDQKLEEIDDELNKNSYLNELEQIYQGANPSKRFQKFEYDMWKMIRKQFKHIAKDFTRHELLPKPTTKRDDEDEF